MQQNHEIKTEPHRYTTELLYHYTCGKCHQWWSYAHTHQPHNLKTPQHLTRLTCPHCGHTERTTPKT